MQGGNTVYIKPK